MGFKVKGLGATPLPLAFALEVRDALALGGSLSVPCATPHETH